MWMLGFRSTVKPKLINMFSITRVQAVFCCSSWFLLDSVFVQSDHSPLCHFTGRWDFQLQQTGSLYFLGMSVHSQTSPPEQNFIHPAFGSVSADPEWPSLQLFIFRGKRVRDVKIYWCRAGMTFEWQVRYKQLIANELVEKCLLLARCLVIVL